MTSQERHLFIVQLEAQRSDLQPGETLRWHAADEWTGGGMWAGTEATLGMAERVGAGLLSAADGQPDAADRSRVRSVLSAWLAQRHPSGRHYPNSCSRAFHLQNSGTFPQNHLGGGLGDGPDKQERGFVFKRRLSQRAAWRYRGSGRIQRA